MRELDTTKKNTIRNKKNTIRELNLEEMESASGGWWPGSSSGPIIIKTGQIDPNGDG